MTRPSLIDWLTAAVTLVILGAAGWVAVAGPAGPMPVHFNADGIADGWAGRVAVGSMVGFIGVIAGVVGGGLGLAAWKAAKADDAARARALRAGQWVAVLATGGVAILMLGTSLTQADSIAASIPMAGTSLLLLVIGAFLGRVGPNPFVGVRTPWAYKSKLAWERSNRLAGRLLALTGVVGLAASAFVPQPAGLFGLVTASVIAAAWSVLESWRVWRDDPERQPF